MVWQNAKLRGKYNNETQPKYIAVLLKLDHFDYYPNAHNKHLIACLLAQTVIYFLV